ncbi:MAG: cytochrome P450 [Deltaproteobacteria bacterium]|nr:cytochrome P450 [Deltaproteobacteria bacterium]NND30917.1 cytochrome P450 [Myxococcales bacterium]MBT8464855.1 cytochrome P450 [Deltaproteobacteria bacterium]MBT8480383.1 cytochrome P450 [Deltaproteobacteria bacterium]NNK07602.1 cytochrome P450 [Myxococcales bacterium]
MRAPAQSATRPLSVGELEKPPRLKGGLPLIGHTVAFVKDTIGLLQRTYDECGRVGRFKLFGKDMILFTGPEAHEALFRQPDEVLSPNAAYKMMVPVFGEGVAYGAEPARMAEQMHMLYPALRNDRMRTYTEIVARETLDVIRDWGEEGVFEAGAFFGTLTNYTSSSCLLGTEFRNEMSEEFSKVYYDLERGIVAWGYIHPYLPIPAFRRRDRARARLGEMVSEIVEKRKQSGYRGEDFLQTLIDSEYADGSKLSDHEITGMLVAAMFAGHHTSSVTTAWTLIELLRNPGFLEEVRDEIRARYAGGEAYSFQSLRDLGKTEGAVKEALRIHPPLFILLRAALQDCEVLGYRVKKGNWVAVSPMIAHRDEQVFENALEYDPGRYGPGREEDRRPFAYISFGGGRHKCMGNAFAILQIKTIIAVLLSGYDFELVGDPVETDFQGLVLGPKPPIRIRYRRRDA